MKGAGPGLIVHDNLSGLVEIQNPDMYVTQRLKHLPNMRKALSSIPSIGEKVTTQEKGFLFCFVLSRNSSCFYSAS